MPGQERPFAAQPVPAGVQFLEVNFGARQLLYPRGPRLARRFVSQQRRNRIILEVRETNLPAQLFFRENGFRAVSVLREYYEDTPEDAYLMQYRYRAERPVMVEPVNRISRLAG